MAKFQLKDNKCLKRASKATSSINLLCIKGGVKNKCKKIIAVLDKYVKLESVNANTSFIIQKKYYPLDFKNDLLQVGIRDDEDIFLILKALCENDADKYRYFTQNHLPTEQWSKIKAVLDDF